MRLTREAGVLFYFSVRVRIERGEQGKKVNRF